MLKVKKKFLPLYALVMKLC